MNERNLEIVDSQKVLGVVIDDSQTWKKHLEKVLKHCRTKIKVLKGMMILGTRVIEKFYYTAIIPSVIYNITVWGNNNVIIKQIDQLHAIDVSNQY